MENLLLYREKNEVAGIGGCGGGTDLSTGEERGAGKEGECKDN